MSEPKIWTHWGYNPEEYGISISFSFMDNYIVFCESMVKQDATDYLEVMGVPRRGYTRRIRIIGNRILKPKAPPKKNAAAKEESA